MEVGSFKILSFFNLVRIILILITRKIRLHQGKKEKEKKTVSYSVFLISKKRSDKGAYLRNWALPLKVFF